MGLVSAATRMSDVPSGVQVVPFAALRGSTWTPFGPPAFVNGGGHGPKNDKGASGFVLLLRVAFVGVLLAEHVGHRLKDSQPAPQAGRERSAGLGRIAAPCLRHRATGPNPQPATTRQTSNRHTRSRQRKRAMASRHRRSELTQRQPISGTPSRARTADQPVSYTATPGPRRESEPSDGNADGNRSAQPGTCCPICVIDSALPARGICHIPNIFQDTPSKGTLLLYSKPRSLEFAAFRTRLVAPRSDS